MLGIDVPNSRLVLKQILVSLIIKFEATIGSLEDTKDLSNTQIDKVVKCVPNSRTKKTPIVEGALTVKFQAS